MLVGVISNEMICGVGVYAACVSNCGGVVEVGKMMGSFAPAKGSARGVCGMFDWGVGVGAIPQTDECAQAESVKEKTMIMIKARGMLGELYLYKLA